MLSPYVTIDTYFSWAVKTVFLWKMKGVKILEIFDLGEDNSKLSLKRQLWMLPDLLQCAL